jgi:hypothetical protein
VHRCLVAVVVVTVSSPAQVLAQSVRGGTAPPEIVHIDGSKRPDLIPQWSAWGFVFRILAGGPRQLPSVVYRLTTTDEAALLLKEADAVQAVDKACHEKVVRLRASAGHDKTDALDRRLREITVDCRQRTLDARDRVLRSLNAEAAAALIDFVESTKSGTSLSIPKRDLARFLEPE